MFGPYEITREGRTWHGNVTLKEHRLVAQGGGYCLFLVPEMTAVPVSAALAQAIARLTPGFATLVPDEVMEALRACGLVADEAGGAEAAEEASGADAADDAGAAAAQEAAAGAAAKAAAAPAAPPFPVLNLALFLTQTCNLRCLYCYGEGGEYGERGVMDEETAHAAVDWLLANSFDEKTVNVSFFGGEPLLNFPLLQRVVAYAKAEAARHGKEVRFGITTNATLLTDEMIAYLAKEQIDPLVSCDGPAPVHDRQRPFRNGRGSHARVAANVRKLRTTLPKLTGRATVCPGSDPFAVRRGLQEAGFTSCLLTAASPVVRHGADVQADPQVEVQAAAERHASAQLMLAYRRAEVAELFAAVRARSLDAEAAPGALTLLAALAAGKKRHAGCGLGRGMRAVAVDGDLYPCHRFVGLEETRLGQLSDYRAGAINDYHRAVVENLPVCRSCWARYFCGGGCFYDNLACTGDMQRPDSLFCDEMRTVCEDVICGWCALSAAEQAYVRERCEKLEEALRR
jgi:uncharacterized protein